MILAGTYAIASVAAAAGPMLLALGEPRLSSLSSIATVAVSLVTAWILTPLFGMFGAATARGVGMIFGAALLILFLRKKFLVQFDLDGIKKSLIAAIVMAVVVMVVEMQIYSKYLMPAYVIVGAVAYVVMLRLLRAIRKDDIQLIRGFLGPKLTFVGNLLNAILAPATE